MPSASTNLQSSRNHDAAETPGSISLPLTPRWVGFTGFQLPLLALLIVSILFGGAHDQTLLIVELVVFLAAVPYAVRLAAEQSSFAPVGFFTTGIVAMLLWLLLVPTLFSGIGAPGPVGATTYLNNLFNHRTLGYFRYVLLVAAFFALFRSALSKRGRGETNYLLGIAVTIAAIALMHWLYDNGKLFWTFAPDNVFTTKRSRWPFVNPDHLAHFLIPAFFLFLGEVLIKLENLIDFSKRYEPARKHGITALLTSKRFQSRIARISVVATGLLATTLAIAGSLSRAAWLAVGLGSLVFFLAEKFLVSRAAVEHAHPIHRTAEEEEDENPRRQRRRRKAVPYSAKLSSWTRALTRPLIVLVAVGIFLFFLNQKGQELIAERIEYGLLNSKEDIRWEMYRDTLPVISESLFFGVGIGNWEPYFRSKMNPTLSGINPVYLHSDPLQFLAETGMLGTVPIAVVALLITGVAIKKLRKAKTEDAVRILALLVALWAALFAACFDFPFRMPAVSLQFALLLATLASLLEDEPVVEAKVLRSRTLPEFPQAEVIEVQ